MTNPKEILFADEAREKLQSGMKQACEAVRVTLGPKGRNVGVSTGSGEPKITSDGHTILQDIELSDVFENMGVSLAKEAASKMKDKCGDGTTTTTLLLNQMVQMGNKFITAGASPISLKRGMDQSVEALVQAIGKLAIQIDSDQQICRIAQVSASGDEKVGAMISEAIQKVGREGIITIDESRSTETTLEIVEGLQFDRGFISPYFINQPEKMTCTFERAYLLITDRKLSQLHDILPLLQGIAASKRPLVIIAEDVEAEALSTLVVNHLRGILNVVAVKAPGFGDRRKALLEDLAIVTGAQLISEERGMHLKDVTLDSLGQADKITITKDSTTLIATPGQQAAIEQRVRLIQREAELASNKYDKEKLLERKAKLLGGIGVIRVGAPSESAQKNLKQKFEDSLNSTKAALESGVVIGAGMALAYSSALLKSLPLVGDELLGAKIILSACSCPAKQIIDNAGFEGNVILSNLLKEEQPRLGFNALTDQVEDLITQGVIDPAKVVIQSLLHACSSASIILLSEALLADAKDEE